MLMIIYEDNGAQQRQSDGRQIHSLVGGDNDEWERQEGKMRYRYVHTDRQTDRQRKERTCYEVGQRAITYSM